MPDNVVSVLHQGNHIDTLIIVLSAIVVILAVTTITLLVHVNKLGKRITALTRGVTKDNLEELLVDCMSRLEHSERRIDGVEHATGVLQAQIPACIQRVGLVRYDAFEDVGGQQSYSVAMLDASGDGIVLTSVFSRMDIRVYAKAVKGGRASHPLSNEEAQAIRDASSK